MAVETRNAWPAKHPSPKNSLPPRTVTIASLPCWEVTASFTLPLWRYHTESAESPCAKIVRSAPNSRTVFPYEIPARNVAQLTDRVFPFAVTSGGSPLPLDLTTLGGFFCFCGVITTSLFSLRHDDFSSLSFISVAGARTSG